MGNFRGKLKNHENHESLAQRIFAHLWYLIITSIRACSEMEGYMQGLIQEGWMAWLATHHKWSLVSKGQHSITASKFLLPESISKGQNLITS